MKFIYFSVMMVISIILYANEDNSYDSLFSNTWKVIVKPYNDAGPEYLVLFKFNLPKQKVVVDTIRNGESFIYEYNFLIDQDNLVRVFTISKDGPAYVFIYDKNNWTIISPLQDAHCEDPILFIDTE